MLPLFQKAQQHANSIAIREEGASYSYEALLAASAHLAQQLLKDEKDLQEARVCFLLPPGFSYVSSLWAIWKAGGVAVPLCLTYPADALIYNLEDTGCRLLLVARQYQSLLQTYASENNIRLLVWEELMELERHIAFNLPDVELRRRALILYTSGTTNKPKGVVTTHANIQAQITTLIAAWQWSANDRTICVLPLHHVHGIINVVGCSLWIGAQCLFLPEFSATAIFKRFITGELNVFMAVPTVYFKLIAQFETLSAEEQQHLTAAMGKFRLMVCGSAALPVSIMEKWKTISGQVLLERYGMTELGMAISNPYEGERRAGYVGLSLPGVSIRLADEAQGLVIAGEPGEIQVKGANVFLEYWNKPDATRETFTTDGWFKTGDMAVMENGYYRILGRSSVDIIKSGGYKISALEIEEVLRELPIIKDCAVVGLPNEEWGELIVAALVLNTPVENFSTATAEAWVLQKMASYKKPRKYLIVDDLPRNAMGKVVKNDVKKIFNDQH